MSNVRFIVSVFLLITLCVTSNISYSAINTFGYVYSKEYLKYREEGKDYKVFVEYNDQGFETSSDTDLPQAEKDKYLGAFVISPDKYNNYLQQYKNLLNQYDNDKLLMHSLKEYKEIEKTIKTVDGDLINSQFLPADTASVFILPSTQIISSKQNIILASFPVNFAANTSTNPQTPLVNLKSLLIGNTEDNKGNILIRSELNIGFRTAFAIDTDFVEEDENGRYSDVKLNPDDFSYIQAPGEVTNNDLILAPISGVKVYDFFNESAGSSTNSDGRYSFRRPSSCYDGFIQDVVTQAEVGISLVDPTKSRPKINIILTNFGNTFCSSFDLGFYDSSLKANFPVDFWVIGGSLTYENFIANRDGTLLYQDATPTIKISRSEPTKHDETRPNLEKLDSTKYADYFFDYNNDNIKDLYQIGYFEYRTEKVNNIDTEVRYWIPGTTNSDKQVLGLFFPPKTKPSSETKNTELQPDYVKQIDYDTSVEFKDFSLLEGISKESITKTDVYVFRDSDGTLVAERTGMSTSDVLGVSENVAYDGFFNIALAGRSIIYARALDSSTNKWTSPSIGGRTPSLLSKLREGAPSNVINSHYNSRNDYLRPGENLTVILINRDTGYIGVKKIILELSGNKTGVIDVGNIKMLPPNLKIWARRKGEFKNGEYRKKFNNLIGFEGGATESDTTIEVYTDWYDQNGGALPEGLSDIGYKARIARSTSKTVLTPEGDAPIDGEFTFDADEKDKFKIKVAEFKIKPGYHLNVLKLKNEKDKENKHVYIHVNPDYRSGVFSDGANKGRPSVYVPVKIPLFNEKKYLDAVGPSKNTSSFDEEVAAQFYEWFYRPEYQFSIWDLNILKLSQCALFNSTGCSENSETILFNENNSSPELYNRDLNVDMAYDLLIKQDFLSNSYRETNTDGKRNIIVEGFSSEYLAFQGENKNLTFVDSSDILTGIRFVYNNDSLNSLWAYSFELARLVTPSGNPESKPVDKGEGQNEFTFDSSSPGKLVVSFKAEALSKGLSLMEFSRRVSFNIEDVGGSPVWSQNNPGGRASVSNGYLVATATFTGLPQKNDDFGRKLVILMVDNVVVQRTEIEVFFNKNATNNPSSKTGLPNWFYYWKEGKVCGIPSTAIYKSDAGFGYVEPQNDTILRLGPDAPTLNTGPEIYTSKLDGNKLTVTGVGAGIFCVAETVEHELHHITIYNAFNGKKDTDGDVIADTGESTYDNVSTSITDPDTYNMVSFNPVYKTYGDNELRARYKEINLSIEVHPEKDWANPGSQTAKKYDGK